MRAFYSNESRTLGHFAWNPAGDLLHQHPVSRERTEWLLYIEFPVESSIKIQYKFLIF